MKSLFNAGAFFLLDMLSTLVFVIVFALTDNIYYATASGIGFGIAQVAAMMMMKRRIDLMQWMSLGLVIVFGTATLLTKNAEFIKLKPSLIYVAVGLVMLKPGWMTRYMPAIVQENGADIVTVYGYLWSALMFATAAANAYVAYNYDMATYAWFLGVVPVVSKIAMFAATYLGIRILVRRRVVAAMGAAQAA